MADRIRIDPAKWKSGERKPRNDKADGNGRWIKGRSKILSALFCSVLFLILLLSPILLCSVLAYSDCPVLSYDKASFLLFIPTPTLLPTPFLLLSTLSLLSLLSYHLSPLMLLSHPIPFSPLTIFPSFPLPLTLTLSLPLTLTLSLSLSPTLYPRHPPP